MTRAKDQKGGPSSDDKHVALEKRVRRLENWWWPVVGIVAGLGALFAFAGISLYSETKEIVEKFAREAAIERVEAEVKEAVPRIVAQETQRAMEAMRPDIERLVDDRVENVIPTSVKLRWAVEELGGNVTEGPKGRLERIDLSGINLGDAEIQRLSSQGGIEHVKSIVLRNTSISIGSIRALAEWPELEEIDIAGTNVTKSDAQRILPSRVAIRAE